MGGTPGDPVNFNSGFRYPPADEFIDDALGGAFTLGNYVSVTTKQMNMIMNRVKSWALEGQSRSNLDEQAVTVGSPFYPGEYQIQSFNWAGTSYKASEAELPVDLPHRPGVYNYDSSVSPPWRGFGADPATEDTLITSTFGDGGEVPPGTYTDDPVSNGYLRFAEWSYTSGNSWEAVGTGFIGFDFGIYGTVWKTDVTSGSTYPTTQVLEAHCYGESEDIVIVGLIGSQTVGKATPILGTIDGFDYNFILTPTEFWEWNGHFNPSTGVPL